MTKLRAAFFDLDDTLCDDAAVWVSCAMKAARIATLQLGIESTELAQAFLQISEAYWMSLEPVTETRPLLEIRSTQWAEALRQVLGSVDLQLAYDLGKDYGERRSTEIELFPDALETIEYFRDHGVKLALLTNGVQLTHVEKIAFLGLEEQFDHILIADAVGFFKPHPAMFTEALRRCGTTPEETIMIGDHIDNDVGGAQTSGITAYWFNPHNHPLPPGKPKPDGTVACLRDVIDLVKDRLD
jgi:putative hydrolase of the HAD superfamily